MQNEQKANFNTQHQGQSAYALNLNQKEFDPVIGRDSEIERMIEILSRRTKSNPILVGQPGVGKTSLIHGLVNKIKAKEVPLNLLDKNIISLDLSVLSGNLLLVKSMLDEITKENNIIFIDEIHNIVGAGRNHGSLDLANIMKPLLTSKEFHCVGATTPEEYRKYFEKDSALVRRFSKIDVLEPSIEDSITILKNSKKIFEDHHRVIIEDEAIESSVNLSVKYLTDRRLPDKAFDLIDEACSNKRIISFRLNEAEREMHEYQSGGLLELASRLKYDTIPKLQKESTIKTSDIQKVISRVTGIPVTDLNKTDREKLLNLESSLKERILGQDEALNKLSNYIKTQRLGLTNGNCSFLFLGSSGVGKTETAKALAKYLFNDEKNMIRFDMSEYKEKHEVSKLIGAPAGYVGYEEGGILTNRVKEKPYSIILFDEIEKAHPEVTDILLQVLDENHLTDNKGQLIDFSNVIIIITSNLNKEVLEQYFRIEFLNRIDETVVFNSLSKEILTGIIKLKLNKLSNSFLKDHKINIMIKENIIRDLVDSSFNIKYGAREVDRLIHKFVKIPLTEILLNKEVQPNQTIIIGSKEKTDKLEKKS